MMTERGLHLPLCHLLLLDFCIHSLTGGMVEIFLFILVAGLLANFIGASVHEGIFVGALVCCLSQQAKTAM